MSRAETTAMLSKLVEKRLKNRVSYWAAARSGMASKATMWRRTKTMHGITPVKSADIRKTTSRGRKKCSKWHVRR